MDIEQLWALYRSGLSYEKLAQQTGVSSSTIKRHLRGVTESHTVPALSGGVVHLDVTYWGRDKGLILGIDSQSGIAVYFKWIGHERKQDYIEAIEAIESKGYNIRAIVLDGGVGLDVGKRLHIVQMCEYHFIAIIRRKLTLHPKQKASKELFDLAKSVTTSEAKEFEARFYAWLEKWSEFLKEKTINPVTNSWQYTHKSLRSSVQTFKEKLPFLFVYQEYTDLEIPNTNKAIEGVFTALKSELRKHNGMSQPNKERFLNGFFRHRDIVQLNLLKKKEEERSE